MSLFVEEKRVDITYHWHVVRSVWLDTVDVNNIS